MPKHFAQNTTLSDLPDSTDQLPSQFLYLYIWPKMTENVKRYTKIMIQFMSVLKLLLFSQNEKGSLAILCVTIFYLRKMKYP